MQPLGPVTRVARFVLGAFVGAFLAFWFSLAIDALSRNFALILGLFAVVGGLAAQLRAPNLPYRLEAVAPYVVGALCAVGLAFAVHSGYQLRLARQACDACCRSAGYAHMVYAPEHRFGPRYCTCSEPEALDLPRVEESACLHVSRGSS